jgi:hypothetical protein
MIAPAMRELRMQRRERVLLLDSGGEAAASGLEQAMAGAVPAQEIHLTRESGPAAVGKFDLALFDLNGAATGETSQLTNEAAKSLKPGGRLVLLALDLASLRLWPQVEGFSELWQRFLELAGHPQELGPGLEETLRAAGTRPRRSSELFCGSCAGQAGFAELSGELLAMLDDSRELLLEDSAFAWTQFDRCQRALRAWRKGPEASLWYRGLYAEGRRRMQEYITLLPGAALSSC